MLNREAERSKMKGEVLLKDLQGKQRNLDLMEMKRYRFYIFRMTLSNSIKVHSENSKV